MLLNSRKEERNSHTRHDVIFLQKTTIYADDDVCIMFHLDVDTCEKKRGQPATDPYHLATAESLLLEKKDTKKLTGKWTIRGQTLCISIRSSYYICINQGLFSLYI